MADNQVKFKRGSASEYAALETKDPDDIYITTDDGKIYLGDKALSGGGGGGTTCTFEGGTNKITVTPSDTGMAQDVDITISVPTANTTTDGITKLYTATGDNEDGTMTQKAITDAISSGGGSEVEEVIFEGQLSASTSMTINLPRALSEYKYLKIEVGSSSLIPDSSGTWYDRPVLITNEINLNEYDTSRYSVCSSSSGDYSCRLIAPILFNVADKGTTLAGLHHIYCSYKAPSRSVWYEELMKQVSLQLSYNTTSSSVSRVSSSYNQYKITGVLK